MRVRNAYERQLLRKSGIIAAKALKKALEAVKEGISEVEVDKVAEAEIYRLGGDLSYKTVPGYKYATCITVNNEVVHGIPNERKFAPGDLVSIDLAVVYKGWHTDCAWSILVGKNNFERESEDFLKAGEEALWQSIREAKEGKRVGDISAAIQGRIEESGYKVVRSLVGHGIGRSLHEDPEIPCFGERGRGSVLKDGMALAIEVIYTQSGSEVVLGEDGWTFASSDGSLGGLFEMSVIVGPEEAEILTDWRIA